MQQRIRIQITGPGAGRGQPPGLLARIALAVFAVFALVLAAFLGAFFFLAAIGLFVVASLVMAVRVWWLRRQLGRGAEPEAGAARQRGSASTPGDVIDGEFSVLDEQSRDRGGER